MKTPDSYKREMAKTPHPNDQPGIRIRLRQLIDERFNGVQGELAAKAGIQPATLSQILNEKSDATIKQLRKIEQNTRARLDWLLTGQEPMFHPLGWVPLNSAPIKQGEYLRQYVESQKANFTQIRLASVLNVARSVITDYFKTENFDIPTRKAILQGLKIVSGDDTLTEETVFFGADSVMDLTASLGMPMRPLGNMMAEPIIELPFVPIRARAGIPTAAFWDQKQETTRIMRATLIGVEPDPSKPKKNWWVIEVDGDSMEPRLISRDRVLAYYVPKENVMDLKAGVWAVQYDDEFVIKRVRANNFEREGGLMLHSDNPPPDPFFVKAESIRHVWFIEKGIDINIR